MTEPRFDSPDVQRVEAALWAAGGTLVMGPNEAARIAVQALRENNEYLLPATSSDQHYCNPSASPAPSVKVPLDLLGRARSVVRDRARGGPSLTWHDESECVCPACVVLVEIDALLADATAPASTPSDAPSTTSEPSR